MRELGRVAINVRAVELLEGLADVRMEALLRRDGRALPAIVWQRMR